MGLDDAWKQLQQTNDIVRFADAKAGLVLTLNGVLVGLVALRVLSAGFLGAHPVAGAALVAALAFLAASVACDIAAVVPRRVSAGRHGALLHFDRIAAEYAGRADDYVDEFVKLCQDPDELQREIAGQVWANSVLARRKYTFLRWGIRFLAGALALSVLAAAAAALGG